MVSNQVMSLRLFLIIRNLLRFIVQLITAKLYMNLKEILLKIYLFFCFNRIHLIQIKIFLKHFCVKQSTIGHFHICHG
jgi:hypothetical protein